jgi:hypothetical protein
MLYVFVRPSEIQLLFVKRGVLGQADFCFGKKTCEKKLITNGGYAHVETLVISLKEAISALPKKVNEREATLVVAHQLYDFYRTIIPEDIKNEQTLAFLRERYRDARKQVDIRKLHFDILTRIHDTITEGFLFAYEKSQLLAVAKALEMIDMRLDALIPESLAYFALFEKTVRLDKKENVLYVVFQNETLEGTVFDSHGPLHEYRPWTLSNITNTNVEMTLHQKSNEYLAKGTKLSRIVISGAASEKIRQDTFTKNVGVWTNPMKRILPNFYQDYVSSLTGKDEESEPFPFLAMDAVFGAYVATREGKVFPASKEAFGEQTLSFTQTITNSSLQPKPMEHQTPKSFRVPKELILFVVIFLVTFAVFYVIANSRTGAPVDVPFLASKPTATQSPEPTIIPPSPTPTIIVNREELRVRVLNGSGITGKAAQLKGLLTDAGYVAVTAGNADRSDYIQSQVNIKPGKMDVKDTVLADIARMISSPTLGQLDAKDSADVVIIIGRDVEN